MSERETRYDIIVVGGGTAGCALAAELLRLTNYRVAVVEAGPRFSALALRPPLAGLRLRPWWSWSDVSVPVAGLGRRQVVFPMGRVLGGTSAVNAMVYAPGSAADHEFLHDGDSRFQTLQDLLAHLHMIGVPSAQPRFLSPFSRAFLEGCQEVGLERVQDLDGSRAQVCGSFPLFQRQGSRWSSSDLLAGSGSRVRILTHTRVRSIDVVAGRAVGVQTDDRRAGRAALRARIGVVLAAGAIHSPLLLQRSGIGPKHLLESAGVSVVEDVPGVGENLQDHVGVPWVVAAREPSPGRKSRWAFAALEFLAGRSGVMMSNCCETGCFVGDSPERATIEIFTHFQTLKQRRSVEFSTILLHPASRGSVGIDPEDPWGRPRIDPNYFAHPADLDALEQGLRTTVAIANSGTLIRFGLAPSRRRVDAGWIRRNASTYYHPGGSCRLSDDADGVVDRRLQVRGVRGLWVADNSVMPEMTGGHPAITALLIGARAAEWIVATAATF